MRLGELLEHLSGYQSDDVIGIAIWGGKDYEIQAIEKVLPGQGIALLATPQCDAYQARGTKETAG